MAQHLRMDVSEKPHIINSWTEAGRKTVLRWAVRVQVAAGLGGGFAGSDKSFHVSS